MAGPGARRLGRVDAASGPCRRWSGGGGERRRLTDAGEAVVLRAPLGHGARLTLDVVILAGAAAGVLFLLHGTPTEAPSASTGPTATVEVTGRRSPTRQASWAGTLGYESPYAVTTARKGTVTRLVVQEAEITRGSELYQLNEMPVVALIGAIPMYRHLSVGADVEQLGCQPRCPRLRRFRRRHKFT